MAALEFPINPVDGQLYPEPAIPGKTQWVYLAASGVWHIVSSLVKTGDQEAFNDYQWPENDGSATYQLTTNGVGVLSWNPQSQPVIQKIDLDEDFNGVLVEFEMFKAGTTTPIAPVPSTNFLAFLGGTPQIEGIDEAYTISGSTLTFTEAPPAGTIFYGVTTVGAVV
jgi:hypothetical protein